jgi:hypothetical protein
MVEFLHHKREERIKEASIGSKLRALVTGRTSLHHGTSPARAAKIKDTGLMPNQSGGISEYLDKNIQGALGDGGLAQANKDLVFTNKTGIRNSGKNQAHTYAAQQRFLDEGVPFQGAYDRAAGAAESLVGRFNPEAGQKVKDMAEMGREFLYGQGGSNKIKQQRRGIGQGLQALRPSTKQGVTTARVPLTEVAQKARPNPEVGMAAARLRQETPIVEAVSDIVGDLPKPVQDFVGGGENVANKAIDYIANYPFANNVVLEGGIPAQYFNKRPVLQRLAETGGHLKNLARHPLQTLKNVAKYG